MGKIPLRNLSLFSGVGGLEIAARLAGSVRTVCYVENNRYCQAVLMSRIRDGSLDDAPIWDDVRTFDGKSWRGRVDVVSGGFPCQDVSVAGKREGIRGSRSGLWFEFARIVGEVGPRFVLMENVAGLIFSGGIGTVLGSLVEMGYDSRWYTLSAREVGAPHLRERVWIVSHSNGVGLEGERGPTKQQEIGPQVSISGGQEKPLAHTSGGRRQEGRLHLRQRKPNQSEIESERNGEIVANSECDATRRLSERKKKKKSIFGISSKNVPDSESEQAPWERQGGFLTESPQCDWWSIEPNVGRVAHGVASRVDRLRCCGNGIVTFQAIPAWEMILKLSERL